MCFDSRKECETTNLNAWACVLKKEGMVLLMVQKSCVHQLRFGSFSHYLQGPLHPRWLFGISQPSTVVRKLQSAANDSKLKNLKVGQKANCLVFEGP